MSLTGKSPSETYKDLIYVGGSNTGVTGTLQSIKTGEGSLSSIKVSNKELSVLPVTDSTSTLSIKDSSGSSKLLVDTTNDYVKANGVHVNTQYAHFGIDYLGAATYAAGYHYPLPFTTNSIVTAGLEDNLHFGNSSDPATSYTTSDNDTGSSVKASYLVGKMWYVPDNIYIDSIYSLEGADNATGDTTRFHLSSYDFTSGNTTPLSNGAVLFNSSDTTNAGNEQPYLSTWSAVSQSVSAGKVILAFFESDTINANYTLSVNVKYHLTG